MGQYLVADVLVSVVRNWEIKHVFTVSGSHIDPLTFAFLRDGAVNLVHCTHELGAAYAADGYARAEDKPGVAIVNASPGFSNLLSALVVSKNEQVPLVVMSGNVPEPIQKTGGFQSSLYDAALSSVLTKATWSITDPEQAAGALQKALTLSNTHPKGPVHLVLPFDVQAARLKNLPELRLSEVFEKSEVAERDSINWEELSLDLHSKKWVLYKGESLRGRDVRPLIARFCEAFSIPLLTTYGAKGTLNEEHPLYFGNAGFAGRKGANALLMDSEVAGITWLGAHTNERNTANWTSSVFAQNRKHIVIGEPVDFPEFIPRPVLHHHPMEPRRFLDKLLQTVERQPQRQVSEHKMNWIESLARFKQSFDYPVQEESKPVIEPSLLIQEMNAQKLKNVNLVVDSGQHRLFPGFYGTVEEESRFFTAPIMAPTGWALCAALGISLADKSRKTMVITGDFCMGMHGMELQTAVRQNRSLLILVFNNRTLAAIQTRLARENIDNTAFASGTPTQWSRFAQAIGGSGQKIDSMEQFRTALKHFMNGENPGVTVLDIQTRFPCFNPDAQFSKSAFA